MEKLKPGQIIYINQNGEWEERQVIRKLPKPCGLSYYELSDGTTIRSDMNTERVRTDTPVEKKRR